ncbi:MAG: DUF2569 family protein [Candidatus Nanoarchaeia archaeon]|nr:DUF2569 family protein [Candidatus Nanoarchaeia archaeon]
MGKQQSGPKGIGGWLWIPTINLFLIAIIWSFNAFIYSLLFFTPEWVGSDLPYLLSAFLIAIPSCYSLFLEIRHKKEFPEWAIITLWLSVGVTFFLSYYEGDYSEGIGLIFAIIWTWYFRVSVRVKNTFIK